MFYPLFALFMAFHDFGAWTNNSYFLNLYPSQRKSCIEHWKSDKLETDVYFIKIAATTCLEDVALLPK